jgi:hypothetical protein
MGDGLFLSAPGLGEIPLGFFQDLLAQTPRRVGGLIVPVNEFGFGGGLAIYLALTEPGMIDLFTNNPQAWGFFSVSGLLDRGANSLVLIRKDAVVVYGSDAAAQRMRQRAEEWVALGRPGYREVRMIAHPVSERSTWYRAQPAAAAPAAISGYMWVVRRRWYAFAVSFAAAPPPA